MIVRQVVGTVSDNIMVVLVTLGTYAFVLMMVLMVRSVHLSSLI